MTRAWSRAFACTVIAVSLSADRAVPPTHLNGDNPQGPRDLMVELERARQLLDAGRYRDSEVQLRELLVEARKPQPPNRAVAGALHTLGLVLHRQGRYLDAYPLLVEALDTAVRIPGLECAEQVNLLSSLGVNHYERGSYEAAEEIYRRALVLAGDGCRDNGRAAKAEALNNLATLALTRGHYDEAESMYQAALLDYAAAYGTEHLRTTVVEENLGRVHQVRGRFAEAESLYRRVLEVRESKLGFHHPDVARSLIYLSGLHALMNDPAKAEVAARRALLIGERSQQAEPVVASALVSLANALRLQQRHVEAEWVYQKALPIFEKEYGPNHPQVAALRLNLAGAYYDQKRYAEAEKLIRSALRIREATFGSGHPKVAAAREALARVLHKLDRAGAAPNTKGHSGAFLSSGKTR